MTALKLVMTTAGLGRFTAAQTDNGVDLTIAEVGFSAASFVAAPTLTALPGEFRRVGTVSGASIGDNIVSMTVQDDAAISYTVRGFGLFLRDGTLFATYSQGTPIVEKATGSMLALAIDIIFPEAGVDQIRFGDTNFLYPAATTTTKGVAELATLAEAEAGDAMRVTTGAIVKSMLATALDAVAQALAGLTSRTIFGAGLVKGGGDLTANRTLTVDAASAADVRAGTRGDLAVTPAGLAALAPDFPGTGEYAPCPGVLHKIGYVPGPLVEGPVQFTFRTPFPNTCVIVIPIGINANGSALRDIYMQEQSIARDGAVAFVQKAGSDGNSLDGFRYLAIGY